MGPGIFNSAEPSWYFCLVWIRFWGEVGVGRAFIAALSFQVKMALNLLVNWKHIGQICPQALFLSHTICCFAIKMTSRVGWFWRRVILKEMGNKSAHLWSPKLLFTASGERVCWWKRHTVLTSSGQDTLCQEANVPGFLSWSNENSIFFDFYTVRCLSVRSVSSSVFVFLFFLLPPKCFFLPTYGLSCFLNESVLLFSDAITSAADLFMYLFVFSSSLNRRWKVEKKIQSAFGGHWTAE